MDQSFLPFPRHTLIQPPWKRDRRYPCFWCDKRAEGIYWANGLAVFHCGEHGERASEFALDAGDGMAIGTGVGRWTWSIWIPDLLALARGRTWRAWYWLRRTKPPISWDDDEDDA